MLDKSFIRAVEEMSKEHDANYIRGLLEITLDAIDKRKRREQYDNETKKGEKHVTIY